MARSYIVHVPPKYDGKTRVPLVIDMHGKGDTAAHQITWSGWREKADAVGLVVIYPQGIGNSWNGGPPGCPILMCCCEPAQDQIQGRPPPSVACLPRRQPRRRLSLRARRRKVTSWPTASDSGWLT